MKNHAHIRAEINGKEFIGDIQGDSKSIALILAEIMKKLDAQGHAEVVREAMMKFLEELPD